jgi:hypothetical protein
MKPLYGVLLKGAAEDLKTNVELADGEPPNAIFWARYDGPDQPFAAWTFNKLLIARTWRARVEDLIMRTGFREHISVRYISPTAMETPPQAGPLATERHFCACGWCGWTFSVDVHTSADCGVYGPNTGWFCPHCGKTHNTLPKRDGKVRGLEVVHS